MYLYIESANLKGGHREIYRLASPLSTAFDGTFEMREL